MLEAANNKITFGDVIRNVARSIVIISRAIDLINFLSLDIVLLLTFFIGEYHCYNNHSCRYWKSERQSTKEDCKYNVWSRVEDQTERASDVTDFFILKLNAQIDDSCY